MLKDSYDDLREVFSEEKRKRAAMEVTLTRDLEAAAMKSQVEIRRVASLHDLDSEHLRNVRTNFFFFILTRKEIFHLKR